MMGVFVMGGACELAGSRAGSRVGVMDARAGRGGSLTCTRQQHTATDFISYYETLCAVQSSCPVSSVRAAAKEGVLNCQVYRLSWSDWQPILTAVSANRSSLHTLVFLDKWRERAYTQLTGVCVCVCVCVCVRVCVWQQQQIPKLYMHKHTQHLTLLHYPHQMCPAITFPSPPVSNK